VKEADLKGGSYVSEILAKNDLTELNARTDSELTVTGPYEDDIKAFLHGDMKSKNSQFGDRLFGGVKTTSEDLPDDAQTAGARNKKLTANGSSAGSLSGPLSRVCMWRDNLKPKLKPLEARLLELWSQLNQRAWFQCARYKIIPILLVLACVSFIWKFCYSISHTPIELLSISSPSYDEEVLSRAVIAAVTRQVVIKNEADMKGPHLRTIIRALVAAEIKDKFTDEAAREYSDAYDSARTIVIKDDNVINMIRSETSDVMKKKLAAYEDDIVGMTDYALRPAGAKIIGPITSRTFVLYPEPRISKFVAQILNFGTVRGKPPGTAVAIHVVYLSR
jgi:hypothetical protein